MNEVNLPPYEVIAAERDEAMTVKQGTFVKSIEDFLAGKPSNTVT